MKIEIVQIADRGKANMERIHLKVLADTVLSYYVILNTSYTTPNSISNNPKHVFWFPSFSVKAGDQVILYTGLGNQKSELSLIGKHNHFFYWGQNATLLNKIGDCVVLLEISSWQTSKYE